MSVKASKILIKSTIGTDILVVAPTGMGKVCSLVKPGKFDALKASIERLFPNPCSSRRG